MTDYYNLFVELSLQQCTKNDYANKLRVRAHNEATKKLKRLQTKMKQNRNEKLFCMLLNHQDDRVRVNAASLCLQSNVFADQAIQVLKSIIDTSDDPTICFAAKMILQTQTTHI